jgi:hypothetical protein
MKTRTANRITAGLLAVGAVGALSLIAVAAAKRASAEPIQPTQVSENVAPLVASNCDRQRLADQLVRYLGEETRVVVKVKELPKGVGGWSLGGRIEISSDTKCEYLPRFIAHELGHELDRASATHNPEDSPRQLERTAECIADRAYIRIYHLDGNPVLCSLEETARAAALAPAWGIK